MIDLSVATEFDNNLKVVAAELSKGNATLADELYRMARDHERKPVVIRNLGKEMETFERRMGTKLDGQARAKIIYTTARMYITTAKAYQELKIKNQPLDNKTVGDERAKQELAGIIEEKDSSII